MAHPLLIVALLAAPQSASSEPILIWQIGKPGNSYKEFAIAGDYQSFASRFPRGVSYRVGESRPEQDWPYVHPGPDDQWAGSKSHPFHIYFSLDRLPAGACRLTIDLANTHYGAPPLLQVEINDRQPYTYQLPAGRDDRSLTDPAFGRSHRVSLAFPSSHLHLGQNVIALTDIRGSWMLYDSVRLESGGDIPTTPKITSVQAESTVLFRRVGGELRQIVRVRVANVGLEGPAVVSLTGPNSAERQVTLISGENVFDIPIRPFETAATATATVRSGAQAASAPFAAKPERKWTVYVGPSAHTDIGYTDLQEKTFQRHIHNTLAALEACAKNPQFKWNLEVAFQAYLFSRTRPKEFAQLMHRAREGRIGVQGSYLNMLTGLCSGEELIECFSRAQTLSRSNGFRVESANISDVPTTVGTLPMLLSGSGVKYFAEAVNSQRGPLFAGAAKSFKQSPFWWESPDGSRILALFSEQYAQASTIGLATSTDELSKRLPNWLKQFDRSDYAPDAVYVYGAFSDNLPIDPKYADIAAEWNRTWEYPKIVVSRVDEFFRYVEKNAGSRLPTLRGDFGVYWEDGAGSSALETAISRRARTRLESAERWLALASLRGSSFPAEAVGDAWDNVLFYDEHTWGAWCATSQPYSEQTKKQWEYKAAYATTAAKQADKLVRSAQAAISAPGQTAAAGKYVVVANEQSWARYVLARVPLPPRAGELRVRDGETGRLLPAQRTNGGLIFEAHDVPPLGVRSYRLEAGKPEAGTPLLQAASDRWTWRFGARTVRFSPSTGAIVELKDGGRNWVNAESGQGINQFIYALGGKNTRMVEQSLRTPKLDVISPTQAKISLLENGPLRAVLRVETEGANLPAVESHIIFAKGGAIDFVNVVHKKETLELEAGYFAFPFNLSRPARTFVELPYGIIEAEHEQLPGACRDWHSANGFVAASDGAHTAILSSREAPLLTIGDIFRGQWRKKLEGPMASIYSYAFNNYWDTNYRAGQGGHLVFTYSLQLVNGPFDPAAATRFGAESLAAACDPAATDSVTQTGTVEALISRSPDLPAAVGLRVAGDQVVVGRITRRNGALLVRLYNPGTKPARAQVSAPGYRSADIRPADLAGYPLPSAGSAGKSVTVPPRGLATLLIRTGKPLQTAGRFYKKSRQNR